MQGANSQEGWGGSEGHIWQAPVSLRGQRVDLMTSEVGDNQGICNPKQTVLVLFVKVSEH